MFEPKESEQVQYIEPLELKQWLSQSDKPLLIDVRDANHHLEFNLGGDNISIYEFASQINQLDPDQMVVIYCQVGQKSFNAASLLIQSDFSSVYSLKGGIEAWRKTVTT
ncbi:rhodanese-like domain-containing protein [Kangiella sp. HZ709]|uniref:rhodanese-like domain-containing protein n=1 Tax=Kangiella sp. HZ709 TaxID=2666328 RepID=UPI0012B0C879|nr:rhodanese-like domain-containing protein [Kangiella sp. HZ709]MRX27997.1 rhodanese-like domain-containing protein [Kangiella sp. HZ709]